MARGKDGRPKGLPSGQRGYSFDKAWVDETAGLDLNLDSPGEAPATRLVNEDRHPWAPSSLNEWENGE